MNMNEISLDITFDIAKNFEAVAPGNVAGELGVFPDNRNLLLTGHFVTPLISCLLLLLDSNIRVF